jgi:hypothetical protein
MIAAANPMTLKKKDTFLFDLDYKNFIVKIHAELHVGYIIAAMILVSLLSVLTWQL